MKIKLNHTFEDLKGVDIKSGVKEEDPALTVKEALLMALNHTPSTLDANGKYDRYKLLRKVEKMEGAEGEVSAEDVVKLKAAVGDYPFITIVHGQLIEALDPEC